MTMTLSELIATKELVTAIREYEAKEDSKPLVERKKELDNYVDEFMQATLTELQECFVSDVLEAVRNKKCDEIKRLGEYGLRVFPLEEYLALRQRAALSLDNEEEVMWHYVAHKNTLKDAALTNGRYDTLSRLLEEETKPSRASELKVIDKELGEQHVSCKNYHDVVVFKKRLREVVDTLLTEQEKTYVFAIVDAVQNNNIASLYNALVLGENTIEDDVRECAYSLTCFFLETWQIRWTNKAMKRLQQWVAAGCDTTKPPKRVYVTKKMLEG